MRNITDEKFGRLTAICVHHSANHRRFWLCNCDCGKQAIIRQDQLTTGKTKSCGCLERERRNRPHIKREYVSAKINGHNRNWKPIKHEQPRLYRIWNSMKSRCYYPKNKCFDSYGGRGISVCDEWRHSFDTFAAWALANGYEDHLTIDRIDVDGNYHPQNCRWITMGDQQKNKRKSPSPK